MNEWMNYHKFSSKFYLKARWARQNFDNNFNRQPSLLKMDGFTEHWAHFKS